MTEQRIQITMSNYLFKKIENVEERRAAAIAYLEEQAVLKAQREAAQAAMMPELEAAHQARYEARNTPEKIAKRAKKMQQTQAADAAYEAFYAKLTEEERIEYREFLQKQSIAGQRGYHIATPAKFQF